MMRDKPDHQKIVSKWQHEKGGIKHSHHKWAKISQLDKENKKRSEKIGHKHFLPMRQAHAA